MLAVQTLAQALTNQRAASLVRRLALPGLLAAIVILAAAVRVVDISDNPPGFFTDEASVGYNAYSILTTGKDEHGESFPLLFRAFGEYKLPVFIYSEVPVIAALGLTEQAVRLSSAAYGILTVLTTYLLASALFRQRSVGLAAAFFLAIMPWHIHFSRTGFGELVTFPFFLTLGLYLFLQGTRRNELWFPAAIVLGLTLYTYRAAWIVLPPLLVLLVVLYHRELLRGWRLALPNLTIIGLIGLPILLHVLTNDSDRSQDIGIRTLDLGAWGTIERFVDHYRTYFSLPFLFEEGDNHWVKRHYLPGFGQLYYVQLPFLALGLLGLLWRPGREKTILLALLALYPVAGALTNESPFSSRTIIGTVVFAILTAYGLMLAVNGLRRLPRRYGQVAAGVLVAAVLAFSFLPRLPGPEPHTNNFVSYLDRYHNEYPKLAADYDGWQAGPKEIIEYFVSVEDSYDLLVMDGEFNAPHIFYPFYAPDDCEKCVIGHPNDKYDPTKRQLFALRPRNMIDDFTYRTREVIQYPNGQTAFFLVEVTGRRPPPPDTATQ